MLKRKCLFLMTLVVLPLSVVLSGCVTTELPAKAVDATTQGQIYYLPRIEFGIEVERELTSCEVNPKTDQKAAAAWLRTQIRELGRVRSILNDKADAEQSIHCPNDRTRMDTSLGGALVERILKQTSGRGTCGSKTIDELKAENQQVLQFLIDSLLGDARFEVSGAAALLRGEGFQAPVSGQSSLEELEAAAAGLPADDVDTHVDLEVDVRATVEPYFLADMDHAYTLEYAGTRKSLKATEYAVETYENGTLKSINAGLEDKTGDVIKASISGIIKVAAAAGGIPLPAATTAPQAGEVPNLQSYESFVEDLRKKTPQICTQEIRSLLVERKLLRKVLGELPEQIRKKAVEVEAAAKALAAAEKALASAKEEGKSGDELKPFEKAVAEKKAAHAAEEAELAAKRKLAEPAAANLARVRAELTRVSRNHLRPDASPAQIEIGGATRAARAWFVQQYLNDYCATVSGACVTMGHEVVPKPLMAWAALYLAPRTASTTPASATSGIVYRQPARGLLIVCTQEACMSQSGDIQVLSDHLVSIGQVDVPQLGVLGRLPLENKAFQNNSLEASFSPSGTLTRVKYSSNARAVAQAETFSESAESLLMFAEATRERDKANLEAETEELTARTSLAQKQLELEKALKELDDFRAGETDTEEEGSEESGEAEGEGGETD